MFDVPETQEDLERVLRTMKRSLLAASSAPKPPDETTELLLDAVNQLVFLVEKLMEQSNRRGNF